MQHLPPEIFDHIESYLDRIPLFCRELYTYAHSNDKYRTIFDKGESSIDKMSRSDQLLVLRRFKCFGVGSQLLHMLNADAKKHGYNMTFKLPNAAVIADRCLGRSHILANMAKIVYSVRSFERYVILFVNDVRLGYSPENMRVVDALVGVVPQENICFMIKDDQQLFNYWASKFDNDTNILDVYCRASNAGDALCRYKYERMMANQ